MGKPELPAITSNAPRPFVKWVGGKRQLLPELLKRLPARIETYYEPFIGGGALMWSLTSARRPRRIVLNDANAELVNAYRVVRDRVEALMADLARHENTSDYFYALRAVDRDERLQSMSPVARASRFIYLNKTAYNGLHRVNRKGQFNAPFGRYANPAILDADNLRTCSAFLQGVEIAEGDFEVVLAAVAPGDLVYFDPPYAPVSRTANFTAYTQGGFCPVRQARLAACCRQIDAAGGRFLLSNSATAEMRTLYDGFVIDEVGAKRAVNSRASGRGKVPELIVRNYD